MNDSLFSVQNKICLITGASSGIGAHFTRLLLNRGATVIGASHTDPDWDTAPFQDNFTHIKADMTSDTKITEIFDHIKREYQPIDLAVNNAGISIIEKAAQFDSETLSKMLAINVTAAGMIARNAASIMRSNNGGSIINVSSIMASSNLTGLSSYAATKAALEQLTRGMAIEWARYAIRINNLAPGWIPTSMTSSMLDRGMSQVLKARTPQNRLGSPEDLDGAFLLLASNASRYMTGTTITVDGGYTLIN